MKSWRAEKRNFYPRRESCLLSCRVVGKYEGYLIGATAIYITLPYMPNRKKGLRLKKWNLVLLSLCLSVCQTLFRMAFSCIWLCGSLIKIKLFISATPAGLHTRIYSRHRENKSSPYSTVDCRLTSARFCLFNWVFWVFIFVEYLHCRRYVILISA